MCSDFLFAHVVSFGLKTHLNPFIPNAFIPSKRCQYYNSFKFKSKISSEIQGIVLAEGPYEMKKNSKQF